MVHACFPCGCDLAPALSCPKETFRGQALYRKHLNTAANVFLGYSSASSCLTGCPLHAPPPFQVAAGGDPDGTLDFYAVHGYAIWDEAERDSLINMFRNPYSHWKVNKPILVGEHWEQVRLG